MKRNSASVRSFRIISTGFRESAVASNKISRKSLHDDSKASLKKTSPKESF